MIYVADEHPFPASCPYGISPDGPAIAVGWLGKAHTFPAGPVPDGFLAALIELGVHDVNVMRGVHPCVFCPRSENRRERRPWIHASSASAGDYLLGHGEIHVRGIHGSSSRLRRSSCTTSTRTDTAPHTRSSTRC